MALRLIMLVALILLLQGCFVDDSSPSGSRPVPPPQAGTTLLTPEKPPESINACAPNQDDWDRITQLYEATELSIHELITCGRVELFHGDVDAEMISCVELFDDRGTTQVEYRADGRRDTVGEIAGSGEIGFDVDEIFATDGAFELVGEASELRYLGIKSLAGRIIYDVVGSGGLTIESDFRSGNAWPVTRFLCEG